MTKVGLIFGGKSGEHEISIASARSIATGLTQYEVIPFYIDRFGFWHEEEESMAVLEGNEGVNLTAFTDLVLPSKMKEVDIWFPVLHGPNGEDGTIQGFLQMTQKPYVGNNVLASAIGMDKIVMKSLFAKAGIPQVNYLSCNLYQWQQQPDTWLETIELELQYPCFVKPSNLGSSVGITKVRNRSELLGGILGAFHYDNRILIEQGVKAREIECGVLGNDQPQASVVGEISYTSDFYDYETKYTPGKATLSIPAPLPPEVTTLVQELAIKAFQTIGGRGLARVDFFYVESSATLLINEINTMPGFTHTSMYPKLWAASGVEFPELCNRLIALALENYDKMQP